MPARAIPAAPSQPLVPALFVLLWSTGFVFAKLGLAYAEPFTFLALRFAIVTALMGVVALACARPGRAGRARSVISP
jgi:drug/metabolite transporter (DMT)-like permease